MTTPTQQSWAFLVGDGADPEVFTDLEGLSEIPDFTPIIRTTRNANTIVNARSDKMIKKRFNRLNNGAEISIRCEALPGSTAQERLESKKGDQSGVNIQVVYYGSDYTYTWTFSAIVLSRSYVLASSNDENAQDEITFNLLANETVQENKQPVISGPLDYPYQQATLAIPPFAYYQMNEASLPDAVDEMGSYNGIYVGSVVLQEPRLSPFGLGKSVKFGAADAYLNVGSVSSVISSATSGISIMLTHKEETSESSVLNNVLFSFSAGSSSLFYLSRNDAAYNARTSSGTTVLYANPTDTEVHHVVLVLKGSASSTTKAVDFYVDGVKRYSSTVPSSGTSNIISVWVGCKNLSGNPSGEYQGWIEDVSFISGELSDSDVTDLYENFLSDI